MSGQSRLTTIVASIVHGYSWILCVGILKINVKAKGIVLYSLIVELVSNIYSDHSSVFLLVWFVPDSWIQSREKMMQPCAKPELFEYSPLMTPRLRRHQKRVNDVFDWWVLIIHVLGDSNQQSWYDFSSPAIVTYGRAVRTANYFGNIQLNKHSLEFQRLKLNAQLLLRFLAPRRREISTTSSRLARGQTILPSSQFTALLSLLVVPRGLWDSAWYLERNCVPSLLLPWTLSGGANFSDRCRRISRCFRRRLRGWRRFRSTCIGSRSGASSSGFWRFWSVWINNVHRFPEYQFKKNVWN